MSNKRRFFSSLIALLLVSFTFACSKKECIKPSQAVLDADFDLSLGKGDTSYQVMLTSPENVRALDMFKEAYIKQMPSHCESAVADKIPKIIHQIWLKDEPLPSQYLESQESWRQAHPNWQLHLWTNKEIKELEFDLKSYFEQASDQEKQNILQAELLDRFGGVYVSLDSICLRPFDELHKKYDFYAGLEPLLRSDFNLVISSSILAAHPQHPLISRWKAAIRSSLQNPKRFQVSLNETIFEYLAKEPGNNIIFPPTYFSPLSSRKDTAKERLKNTSSVKRKIHQILIDLHLKRPDSPCDINAETMAVSSLQENRGKSIEEKLVDLQQETYKLQNEQREEIKRLKEELNKVQLELKQRRQQVQNSQEIIENHIAI